MYNDSIKVANKIITAEDLEEIFVKMNEKLLYYQNLSVKEEARNQGIESYNRVFSYKDRGSNLKVTVNFHDNTTIKFDRYDEFITIFHQRLEEIKDMFVVFCLNYETRELGRGTTWENQHIWIYENQMNIDVSLSSTDHKMDDVYELIKTKILNAPEKYDRTIKRKSRIIMTVGFAIGIIPAIVFVTLLLLVKEIRLFFSSTIILYPICTTLLGLGLGTTIGSVQISSLYSKISPRKVYAGHNDKGSIYKDDIEEFTKKGEILIGRNVDNLEIRNQIEKMNQKYKKWIPIELGLILILSIILLFV